MASYDGAPAGYSDIGAAWRKELELGIEDVRAVVERLYGQVTRLYQLLHSVVRDALQRQYGPHLVPHDKPIPVHLSGGWIEGTLRNISALSYTK